jgi:acetyltransferase-like isoleucine patch superfamily enzyme
VTEPCGPLARRHEDRTAALAGRQPSPSASVTADPHVVCPRGAEVASCVDVQLARAITLQGLRGIQCGGRVYIHRRTQLDLRGGITVGNDVAISPGCQILTADHDPDSPTRAYRERGGVTIEDRAWLATGASIMPGTRVSEGCVVAGYAVASGILEPWSIYAGSPAVRKRERARTAQARLAGSMSRFSRARHESRCLN